MLTETLLIRTLYMSAEPETRLAKLPFIPASPCVLIIILEQQTKLKINATSLTWKKERPLCRKEK